MSPSPVGHQVGPTGLDEIAFGSAMCFAPNVMIKGKFKGSLENYIKFHGENSTKALMKAGVIAIIPCGQCKQCRANYAKNWAARCQNESKYWKNTAFITLTYDEKHIPVVDKTTGEIYRGFRHPKEYYLNNKRYENSTLYKPDMQKFLKRLRKYAKEHGLEENPEKGLKVFYCGEYGSKTQRAHYHLLIYGLIIPDLYVWKRMKGIEYDRSTIIEKEWGMGNVIIGALNYKTCAYVAKYVMKKWTGPDKMAKYKEDGRSPEFTQMSLKPAIGQKYWEEHRKSIYKYDSVLIEGGKTVKPPKYYDIKEDDKQLEEAGVNVKKIRDAEKCRGAQEKGLPKMHSEKMQELKRQRRKKAMDSLFAQLEKTTVTLTEYMKIKAERWKEKNRKTVNREGNYIAG